MGGPEALAPSDPHLTPGNYENLLMVIITRQILHESASSSEGFLICLGLLGSRFRALGGG